MSTVADDPVMSRAMVAVRLGSAVLGPHAKAIDIENFALDLMSVPQQRLETILHTIAPPKPSEDADLRTIWDRIAADPAR